MKKMEKRNLNISDVETRENEGKKFLVGKIPYNKPSEEMYIGYSNASREIISPTAFHKTIGDGGKVLAYYQHDEENILGNTKSGTLVLRDSPDGLICECELPNTEIANRAWEAVARKDCTTLSFEFIPREFVEDRTADTVTLTSAQLLAVNYCVPNPAYPDSDSFAFLRSLCQKRNINLEKVETAINENKVDSTDKEQVESLLNLRSELNEIIKTLPEEKKPEQVIENSAETKTAVVASEQPASIQKENTETKFDEAYQQKLEQLEKINQELEKEISE